MPSTPSMSSARPASPTLSPKIVDAIGVVPLAERRSRRRRNRRTESSSPSLPMSVSLPSEW